MSSPPIAVPFVDLQAQYRNIREQIDAAIRGVIESSAFIGGPTVEQFEQEFAAYVGAEFAVGVANGTDAIELALRTAGIGPGHDVIVPANTYFATAEAVSNVGARPIFADIDPLTFHLSLDSAARVITPQTSAIIPVHLFGRAMDMRSVEEFALSHKLTIIEDAAQAHGAAYHGKRVGASGRLTCFSFYPGKNLGAYGDGGAVTTSDPEQAKLLRVLRDHGSPVKFQHVCIGRNSRLDGLQGAILGAKLPHLDGWNGMRWKHAQDYNRALADLDMVTPELPPAGEHIFHLYVIRVRDREGLRLHLSQRGISSGIHYPVPLHLTEAYQALGAPKRGSLPVAEEYAGQILSLPMFAELTQEQIAVTCDAVQEFLATQPAARAVRRKAPGND